MRVRASKAPVRPTFHGYARDVAARHVRSPNGFSSGDLEAGLAEKPDHLIAKFADRVLAHRGHQQMVHQRAAEHVGQRFEIGVSCQQTSCLHAPQGADES